VDLGDVALPSLSAATTYTQTLSAGVAAAVRTTGAGVSILPTGGPPFTVSHEV
jgi:hypothetical protein